MGGVVAFLFWNALAWFGIALLGSAIKWRELERERIEATGEGQPRVLGVIRGELGLPGEAEERIGHHLHEPNEPHERQRGRELNDDERLPHGEGS